MGNQDSLNEAFAAMLGGLPETPITQPVEEVKETPRTVATPVSSDLIQKKPTVELRDKRKQFMLTQSMCDKLKRYASEYELSENEIICQLIGRLP